MPKDQEKKKENLNNDSSENIDNQVNDDTSSNSDNGQEISDLQSQIEEQRNKYLQLMAEFQNYKKRMDEEKALFGAMGSLSIIQDVLEIHDDLNMAVNDENLSSENAKSSIKSAQEKMLNSIKRGGIEIVEVKTGDEFNKDTMEAISTLPTEDEAMRGKVVAVVSSAFKFKDREGVIKHAKVIVGK